MRLLLLVWLGVGAWAASAETPRWSVTSGPAVVPLLELYTSEGCSSCPPAETWLSRLVDAPGLWRTIVPVAFHVTYWDDLGWPDRYGSGFATERQYRYADAWHSRTVYTPMFVRQGREWQIGAKPAPEAPGGQLALTYDGTFLAATYTPAQPVAPPLELHLALLGCDLTVAVASGENAGRRLRHDFVVLAHRADALPQHGPSYTLTTRLPATGKPLPARAALAVWVARPDAPAPLQAAGGWLTADQVSGGATKKVGEK